MRRTVSETVSHRLVTMACMSTTLDEQQAAEIGLTWDAYLALPYETRNTDLIDGRLVVNAPTFQHEIVVRNVLLAITLWRATQPVMPGAVTTQPAVRAATNRGYQPDVAWFPECQVVRGEHSDEVTGLPSIAIEVLSPSTRRTDIVRKRADYERLGVLEYWILDPKDRSATVLRRREQTGPFTEERLTATDSIESWELPGFTAIVGPLFRDL
jgi:Uma2 family endonuclease